MLCRREYFWGRYLRENYTTTQEPPCTFYPENYAGMFLDLKGKGCSITNLQKATAANSLEEFKTRLISYHPEKKTDIAYNIWNYEER